MAANDFCLTSYTDTQLLAMMIGILQGGGQDLSNATFLDTVQTSAIGATWVPLPSFAALAVEVLNDTGTSLEFRRNGSSETYVLPNQTAKMFGNITDADQIELRRFDQSNTQVTVHSIEAYAQ